MRAKGVIVHHSLTKDGKTVDWEAIRRYHIEVNKWSDIGYHVGVERVSGKLTTQIGRPLMQIGAHCLGKNDHIGIYIVGNFDVAPPDDELLDYSAKVVAGYLTTAKLAPETVHRHHEYHPKSCPGTKFPWERFMVLVRSHHGAPKG
jgi:N-acetylmuramoyl-L-alanine amidase